RQDLLVPISGFALQRSDVEAFSNLSETKNINELASDIDSLRYNSDSIATRFKGQLIKNYIFRRYSSAKDLDSLPQYAKSDFVLSRIDTMNVVGRKKVFSQAKQVGIDAQNFVNYEVEFARFAAISLYKSQADFQRKISLPFSIMIFFLIGTAFGAIIRKGGLGMPIVVSVAFFVVYYVISMIGKKFLEDGVISPFIGVWLPSFVLFPMAIFLTYKSTNDSVLFNSDMYVDKYKQVIQYIKKHYKRKYEKNS
ncbi:MAG: LptF/LptG family permease, partial [Mucinivorans sp.]